MTWNIRSVIWAATACLPILAATAAADPPRLDNIDTPFWTQKAAAIVGIKTERTDGTAYKGTGFWVSDRFIATARHLVAAYSSEPCRRNGDAPPTAVNSIIIWPGRPSDIAAPRFVISVQDHHDSIIEIPDSDIAFVDVQPQDPPPSTLLVEVSPTLTKGDTLHVYGFPLGDPAVPLRGVVALTETHTRNYMSTLFNLQEGYSGSPVANNAGDIIGLDSCGDNGYEYISLLQAANSFVHNQGIPQRGRPLNFIQSNNTLTIAGTVQVYDAGNSVTNPPRPAGQGEVLIVVRDARTQGVIGEGRTNDDQGSFLVVTSLSINEAPTNLVLSLIQRNDGDNASPGKPWNYISNPIPIVVDRSTVIQQLKPPATIWERDRYVLNTLLQARQVTEAIVKSLPNCFRTLESQKRAFCVDSNPHILDAQRDQIEAARGIYIDAISKIPQSAHTTIAARSLDLGTFLDTIGDPCGAVVSTENSLRYRDLDQSFSYAGRFSTWVTSCASSSSSFTIFDLSKTEKDSRAIWGLQILADVFGYLPAIRNADGSVKVILSNFLTLFESIQGKDTIGNSFLSNAEKISTDPTLSGIFRYFIENWVNPVCHKSYNSSDARRVEEAMRDLRLSLSANKCQFDNAEKAARNLTEGLPRKLRWELLRVDDCPGKDNEEPTMGEIPVDSNCTGTGITAVCWDGKRFRNGIGPWCTYKTVPPSSCSGGSAPGRLYRCARE
jgi:V8-like Glu-specific endopeptidase